MSSIPSFMRAAALDGFGEPGVLTIHMLPVPVPDAHEILVAVHTAGVGTWDADMRAGWWPEGKPAFPLVLGTDGSGTVVTAGSSVRRYGVEPEPNQRSGIELISYDAVSGVPEFERLGEAIEQSKRVVPVAAEYPLAEAKAHERLAAGHLLGKIVLRVQPA